MSHDDEEVERGSFNENTDDEELLEPLEHDFGSDDEEEHDKN